jgi:hypothetical protein
METRRIFFGKMVLSLAFASFMLFAPKVQAQESKMNNVLLHNVYFWLKEPQNPEARKQFEAAIDKLVKIDNIKMSHLGVPASTEQRDVVDHSYTYAMMLVFESKEAQDIYQVHPLHVQFVEENSHLWEKVLVYDSTDIE